MPSIIGDKSYDFSLRIIKLYKYLCGQKKEYIIAKQVLRCGTSIGVNVREGLSGESTKDFIHKMAISLKEDQETDYWLSLLKDSEFIKKEDF